MFYEHLIQPVKAMRRRYLPLLMIYFAYGCATFSGIGEAFFVKERMGLGADALMMIAVWLTLPWNIKMVFGQLIDSVPFLGSQRKSYIFIAAGFMACGAILMAGLAGQWAWVIPLGHENAIFITASLLTVIGTVLQDVVADAMSVEVVARDGRVQQDIDRDLAMVQLLGRLAMSFGMFIVAGLGGWIAHVVSYPTLFLLTLIIPIISISGSLLARIDVPARKPLNLTVLGGGLFYAIFVVSMGLLHIPYGQEIILVVSLVIVIWLLRSVTREIPKPLIGSLICAATVIFLFRAMPPAGPGASWFMMDVLGFDKAFFGTLSQIGAGLSIIGMWLFARLITERSVAFVLGWLTVISFILSTPLIGLFYGLHEWTQTYFGFGAHTIALIDTAVGSPFAQLAMIPMLALTAKYAPKGNAATWFALMTSLMNLALTTGSLVSKYLNKIFNITRAVPAQGIQADYSQLGMLLIIIAVIGLVIPLSAVFWLVRKDKTAI